jgi:hypothetical protein
MAAQAVSWMWHHPGSRERIAELQFELSALAERDGQRYTMTRQGLVASSE